jgi:hypothetical protein
MIGLISLLLSSMDDHFNYTASKLSDPELRENIDNRQDYLPETVEAAITELQSRGVEFTDEELQVFHADIEAHSNNASLPNKSIGLFNKEYQNNLVKDPAAPSLYSRRALYIFTVLLGAMFGAIMLAINAGKVKNRDGILWTLLFGVCFTAIQLIIIDKTASGTSLGIVFGIAAAYCFDYFFWGKFIGNETFYRAKPIWVPLIIAIILVSLLVWATIYSGQHPVSNL